MLDQSNLKCYVASACFTAFILLLLEMLAAQHRHSSDSSCQMRVVDCFVHQPVLILLLIIITITIILIHGRLVDVSPTNTSRRSARAWSYDTYEAHAVELTDMDMTLGFQYIRTIVSWDIIYYKPQNYGCISTSIWNSTPNQCLRWRKAIFLCCSHVWTHPFGVVQKCMLYPNVCQVPSEGSRKNVGFWDTIFSDKLILINFRTFIPVNAFLAAGKICAFGI